MKRSDIVAALIALGYKAEAHETVKNGVIFEGITINNDAVVAPIIYTQQLIDEAERRGKGVSDVVNEVIRVYEENRWPGIDASRFLEREFILPRLRIGIQKESDEDLEKRDCELEGLEAYLYVNGGKEDGHGNEFCIKANKSYLQNAGIDPAEAWTIAEKHTFAETRIRKMSEVIADICEITYDESVEMDLGNPFYVVGNTSGVKGASAILDRKALEEFGREHGIDKVLVLPSSIHEMLIVPYDECLMNLDEYSEMVRSINEAEVAPEEQLTDRAYIMTL